MSDTITITKDAIIIEKGGAGSGRYPKGSRTYKPPKHGGVKSEKISGTISNKRIEAAIERGGYVGERNGKNYLLSPQTGGGIAAYIGTKGKKGFELEGRSDKNFTLLDDARKWSIDIIDQS